MVVYIIRFIRVISCYRKIVQHGVFKRGVKKKLPFIRISVLFNQIIIDPDSNKVSPEGSFEIRPPFRVEIIPSWVPFCVP
jgi:hypothetical protein